MNDVERVTDDRIIPTPLSDHRLVMVHFNVADDGQIGGKGLWKHNDTLLKEEEYINMIEAVIDDCLKCNETSDPRKHWEWLKFKVRHASIKYSKARAKLKKEELERVEKNYSECVNEPQKFTDEDRLDRERQLVKCYEEIHESIRFRANVENVEKGEKVTKFSLDQLSKIKLIQILIN